MKNNTVRVQPETFHIIANKALSENMSVAAYASRLLLHHINSRLPASQQITATTRIHTPVARTTILKNHGIIRIHPEVYKGLIPIAHKEWKSPSGYASLFLAEHAQTLSNTKNKIKGNRSYPSTRKSA